jgi:hypothetical protein
MSTRAEDRPMTRGGLGGFQINQGFNRQVKDKTYYAGLIKLAFSYNIYIYIYIYVN